VDVRDAAALRERLGMGLLLLGMGVGLAAQFTLAWAWARPGSGPPPAALGAGLLVAILGRALGSVARDDGGADNEIAWVGLLVGAGLAIAFMHIGPQSGPPAVLAAGCLWAVWWLTGYIWRNLLVALPPLPEEGAGAETQAASALDIAANVQAGAFGGVLAAAAVAVIALQLRHGRTGPPVELGAIAMALQCGCACLLVAQGQRRALLRQARVYRAVVLPGFASGSATGALLVTALLMVVAVLIPAYPALVPHLHLGPAGASLVHHGIAPPAAPPRLRPQAPPATTAGGGGGTAFAGNGGILAGLAVILAVVGVVVVAAAIRLGVVWVRAGFGRRVSFLEFLGDLWQAIIDMLAALFAGVGLLGLWGLLFGGPTRQAAGADGSGGGGGRRESVWAHLTDPRARVRAAYRHMLAGVGGKGHRRPHWFSPARFREHLQPALPAHREDLGRLTRLYEEARYSTHALRTDAAGRAEVDAETVVRQARSAREQAAGPEAQR